MDRCDDVARTRRRCPFGGGVRINVTRVWRMVFEKRRPTGFHSIIRSRSSNSVSVTKPKYQYPASKGAINHT
jgi:hypothetical protein